MSGQDVVDKIDELLKDDANFTTRSGLRLSFEVLKDAINANLKAQAIIDSYEDRQDEIEVKVKDVETKLNGLIETRQKERDKDEAERTKWRWAILGPSVGLLVVQIGSFIFWLAKLVIQATTGNVGP